MKYNVMLFILDTLREDYSRGLLELERNGFVRYENAITPAPWTLPTHISIFTGLLPSQHNVHEHLGAQYYELHAESRKALSRSPTLTNTLENEGYGSYAFSSNPMICRRFGFHFDYYCDFEQDPRERKLNSLLSENAFLGHTSKLKKATFLIRRHNLGLASYVFYNKILKARTGMPAGSRSLPDKFTRSRRFLEAIREKKFEEPFFLFVNLMEAHEPYLRGEEREDAFLHKQFDFLTGSSFHSKQLDIQRKYAKHAKLSTKRLIDMMSVLEPLFEKSVIIVTSDHGQLLGEQNKYGHGCFLDDELLKVPLFVRYPSACKPLIQRRGSFINLIEIPKIVRFAFDQGVCHDKDIFSLGSEATVSESFGIMSDCSKFASNDEQLNKFRNSYSRRIRLYSTEGNALYDFDSDSFDEIGGNLNVAEAKKLIFKTLDRVGSAEANMPLTNATAIEGTGQEVFSEAEIHDIEAKLGTLGYL